MCPNLSSYMTGLWSYGAWVYNYLYKQCPSKPAHGNVYSIQHYVIKFVSGDRSVVFSGYAGFLHLSNWPPRYKWYIVKSGGKNHNPNPSFHTCPCTLMAWYRHFNKKWWDLVNKILTFLRRVWRYQRGNLNLYIEEEQTTKWPKEKGQKNKQRSTKHTHKTKYRVTRTPIKQGLKGVQFLLH